MTATERVITYLSDHGPAPTSEIAQALSTEYGAGTVRRAVAELKQKGQVVDTGERHKTTTKPEHIVALDRELERARVKREFEELIRTYHKTYEPTIWQRVKRLFGGR